MRCAVEEWFAKADKSVAEAKAQGCIYFDCRRFSGKKGRRIGLVFADGKGKKLQRTLIISATGDFNGTGSLCQWEKLLDLKMALQSLIIKEGLVVMDRKAL